MKTLLQIIVLLFFYNSFSQTNFYVDKVSGNDTNNGSAATPWKTIQKAANAAVPNSIVNIKAGTYNENVIVNVSGTAGNYIVFKNYLNDVVLIDGSGTTGSTLLTVTNKRYLKFENFTIQNKTVNDAQGLLVETTGSNTSTDLTFTNIKIKNINWTSSASTVPTETKNAQGFIAYGRNGGITNLTLDNCEVSNNILGFSEALAINGNIDGFTVKNCIVHDNTNIGIDILGHEGTASPAALDEARNGVVANNICYNNVSNYATSAGIYVDGAKNIIIERNKCYQNGWGIEIGAELNGTVQLITVKNNLIYNNQQAGLSIGGYDTGTTGQVINCIVRNNTFLKNNSLNDGTGELTMTKASNCTFENNIFYTNTQNVLMSVENITPQSNNTFNYNCWYSPNNNSNAVTVNWRGTSYSSFASYKTGTSQDNNSTYSNPNLTSLNLTSPDFKLLAGSGCIDTGKPATLITTGELDYYSFNRITNTTIDKGAHEFSSFSLGINNNLKLNSIIYPNPSKGRLNIVYGDADNDTFITVYNSLGQIIIKKNTPDLFNEVNLSGIINGIYFIEVNRNNQKKVIKVVLEK
ncbi:T9SS type A sorting domain-containing protein [Flavobacterium sp.]|uniref:T9SS type A sorting domain-containing protein n=1 Tax=Flavobacterium sp. TaxID=239 RepID=UPI0032658924